MFRVYITNLRLITYFRLHIVKLSFYMIKLMYIKISDTTFIFKRSRLQRHFDIEICICYLKEDYIKYPINFLFTHTNSLPYI